MKKLKKAEFGDGPERKFPLLGSLDDMMQWTILQHGLYKGAPTQPALKNPHMGPQDTNPHAGPNPWDKYVQSANSYINSVEPIAPTNQPPKKKLDWSNIAASGLSAIDALLPGQKPKNTLIRPTGSYNPNAYGTGSQAIAKFGASLFGGGEDDPRKKPAVYQTQADVNSANAFAQRMALKNGITQVQRPAYVASKPGDPIVPFVDESGNPYTGPKNSPAALSVLPSHITGKDFHAAEGRYWYEDPHTGESFDINPGLFNSPRYKKDIVNPPLSAQRLNALSNPLTATAQLKNGGKMKKCKEGGSLPIHYAEGSTHDLDPQTIQHLLSQGYELDFQ